MAVKVQLEQTALVLGILALDSGLAEFSALDYLHDADYTAKRGLKVDGITLRSRHYDLALTVVELLDKSRHVKVVDLKFCHCENLLTVYSRRTNMSPVFLSYNKIPKMSRAVTVLSEKFYFWGL